MNSYQLIVHVKNKKRQCNISIDAIDLTSDTLSYFMSDGKAYRGVTSEIIKKITLGELIVTEYHEQPLGHVVYLEVNSINN